ncbi:hypothetical protein ACOSQ4_031311 [Xanthoceras sorbifolium]
MASSSSNTCQQTQTQQSQQSPAMDFGSLAKTLHFNLPIKLDEDNYIYWNTQILTAINALDLEEYIDSSKHPPPQFFNVQIPDESRNVRIEQQLNKEYQRWKKSDQILLFWLISTLSQKVVGQITKCKSSLRAWTKLENLYSQRSMIKILNLRQQLQTIRKGSHSISDFVLKIKNIGDALSAAGEEVSERDLLLSLMHGVGHEYDAVVVLISSQKMTMSLEEAQFFGEFLPFVPYLSKQGVQVRFSCAHIHAQSGVVERKHRHLVETGLTLLAHAKMPLMFWFEAFSTICFLVNNLPTYLHNSF